jgi:hypothetical protein
MTVLFLFNLLVCFPIITQKALLAIILILSINCAILFYKNRYLKIIDYYDNPPNDKVASSLFYGYIFIAIYIILTFVALLYFGPKTKG